MVNHEDSNATPPQAFFTRGEKIQPFPQDARKEIGEALIDLFHSLHEFMLTFGSEPPEDDSRAGKLLHEKHLGGEWTATPAVDVTKTVMITSISAFDHGTQLGYALRDGNGVSSLATIARGCVEAMARVFWLITPQDPQETVVRLLSGLHSELALRDRLESGSQVVNSEGSLISITEPIGKIDQQLKQLGCEKPLSIKYTDLATEFLKFANSQARLLYSRMSGVAHAEQIALWGYVGFSNSAAQFKWNLNFEEGLASAEMVYYPLGFFMRELLSWVGREAPKDADWPRLHDEFRVLLQKWRAIQAKQVKKE